MLYTMITNSAKTNILYMNIDTHVYNGSLYREPTACLVVKSRTQSDAESREVGNVCERGTRCVVPNNDVGHVPQGLLGD